jgi:hypothetical protein
MAGESNMVLIGGLWKSQTQAGVNMMSGSLTRTSKIIILPNKKKQPGDKSPDALMFIAPIEKKDDQGGDDRNDGMI